ncbi:hypothetical protein Btru_073518 [Bulinus truncatus]|nr:hypothetical protein Btru_073518 [Bulinus truncatus]
MMKAKNISVLGCRKLSSISSCLRLSLDLVLPVIILALLAFLIMQNRDDHDTISRVLSLKYIHFPLIKEKGNATGQPQIDQEEMVSSDVWRNFTIINENLFENITKMADKESLFKEIPEETYLQPNNSYFTSNSSFAGKDYNFNFLINGESICAKGAPYILIIIPSQIDKRDLREAIRRTWLIAAEMNTWRRFKITKTIKHIFLFGYRSKMEQDDFKLLQSESVEHGDIVVVNVIDTYRNLSLKILSGIEWTLKYCSGVDYLLKVDDDTLINAPLMVELLVHVQNRSKDNKFVLGLMHTYKKPEVSRSGRWEVSEKDYPFRYYPKYFYGHSYAISGASLQLISAVAKKVTLIAPEDAYFTGILPKFAGIKRLHAPSFTVCCRSVYDCEVVWNKRVALTDLHKTERLNILWASILQNSCNDQEPFIDKRKFLGNLKV